MSVIAPRAAEGGLIGEEVFVAGEQRIFVAPVGTTIPEDTDEDFGTGWVDLGYTTEDGLAVSLGKDTDDLLTSQSLDPVRKLVTGAPKTITAPLRQVNEHNLVLALGGGTVTRDGTKFHFTPAPASFIDYRAVGVEGIDGGKKLRLVFYRCMISEAVEFTLVNTASIIFPLTFSVLANEPPFDVFMEEGGEEVLTPSLVTVAPETGDAGDTVTLTGTNFAEGLVVSFGAVGATGVNRASATSATCTVPAGSGTVSVSVRNPGNNTPGTLANAFTYE